MQHSLETPIPETPTALLKVPSSLFKVKSSLTLDETNSRRATTNFNQHHHTNYTFFFAFSADSAPLQYHIQNMIFSVRDAIQQSLEVLAAEHDVQGLDPDYTHYNLYAAKKNGKRKSDLPSFDSTQLLEKTKVDCFILEYKDKMKPKIYQQQISNIGTGVTTSKNNKNCNSNKSSSDSDSDSDSSGSLSSSNQINESSASSNLASQAKQKQSQETQGLLGGERTAAAGTFSGTITSDKAVAADKKAKSERSQQKPVVEKGVSIRNSGANQNVNNINNSNNEYAAYYRNSMDKISQKQSTKPIEKIPEDNNVKCLCFRPPRR